MNLARLLVSCTGRRYNPGDTPGTHFCQRLCQPHGHSGKIIDSSNCIPPHVVTKYVPLNFTMKWVRYTGYFIRLSLL